MLALWARLVARARVNQTHVMQKLDIWLLGHMYFLGRTNLKALPGQADGGERIGRFS